MTFTMSGVLDDSLHAVTPPETRNCATLQLVSTDGSSIETQVGPSCAPINVTPVIDSGSVLDVDYALRKACQRQAGLGANDLVQCEISVDPAGGAGAKGRYTVTDRWDGDNGGGSGVLQIAGPEGWTCGAAPFGPENPVSCSVDAAEFSAAGKPAVLTLVASVPRTMLNAPGMQNCVTGDLDGVAVGEKACHVFTPSKDDVIDTPDAPKLVVEKSLVEACRVNKSARIYECDFALTVRNEGGSVFEGPLVLNDSFGSPKPRDVRTTGQDGWDCLRSDGLGTSCLNGSAVIEPGASSSLTMGLTLPGLTRGGSFENCAAIGMGDSDFQRATIVQSVMQRLDIDGGPVDGAPGPKTRQGVRILQERLGLEPTGQIDETLFAALGVPAVDAEAQSCVTAELPPIPMPVVTCKPGQKKNSKGQCYTPEVVCRDGQVKNSKGQCYTPKKDEPRACAAGQKRNSKGQCYTPKKTCPKGQKLNSKNQCYTPRPTCDAKSTVRRGDGCACRYRGMTKVTASRCVCSNGSPIVPGAGCIRVEKKETDGPAGTEGGKRCVVIGGVRICK
ncbi:hypothetical protein GQR58_029786 [Nymphon striatum]|nr:hypothetical protein GQR58_029786 [Nymphon striatum]